MKEKWGGMGEAKVGLEQKGTREEMWRESRDLCKSGKCCAAARGAEEAILMLGGEQRR